MTRNYCTYFDRRYLSRALALYQSLVRHGSDFRLWALCLDDGALDRIRQLGLPRVEAVPLAELERADPELAATRGTRSLIEYYFTCSPCLPFWLLTRDNRLREITYLDADLWFFSSPEPIFDEMSDCSVAIVPHRFSTPIEPKFRRYGRYNVGWLTFRRSGLDCLAWWRARCLEWCFDRVDGDRYADQKYLERFPVLFSHVHEISHPGANLAPWNIARHRLSRAGDTVLVDGRPLAFFHFQGVSRMFGTVYDCNMVSYSARMDPVARYGIFVPYLRELAAQEHQHLHSQTVLRTKRGLARRAINTVGRAARHARTLLSLGFVRI